MLHHVSLCLCLASVATILVKAFRRRLPVLVCPDGWHSGSLVSTTLLLVSSSV